MILVNGVGGGDAIAPTQNSLVSDLWRISSSARLQVFIPSSTFLLASINSSFNLHLPSFSRS